MSDKSPYLTKSRYVQGLACKRWLWLGWHDRLPYEDPEPGTPAAVGIEVGEHAHKLFPGGISVSEAAYEHDAAVSRTAELMADPDVPAIFEAAFEHDGIRIRADVIERLDGDRWGLREVKSSTRVKPEHVDDAAIQWYVMRELGFDVGSVELVHVNRDYFRGDGEIDWNGYFARTDLSREAGAVMGELREQIGEQKAVLARSRVPGIAPGPHCPDICPYWDKCTASKPDDWIMRLPHMTQRKFDALQDIGVDRIRNIPDDFSLTEVQDRIRDVVISGRAYVSPNLAAALAPLDAGATYLDFEAMNPAIPAFRGNRPYQRIPFQWSLHTVGGDGGITHAEYLAPADADPRPGFAASLIDALAGTTGPIVVYSSYEKSVLSELASEVPDAAGPLNSIIDRLFDLLGIVRREVYMDAFGGSFSIKAVGQALSPAFSYDDLTAVKDGQAASIAFQKLANGSVTSPEADDLRQGLLAYCERDTLAMVEVHKALADLASRPQGTPAAASR